MHAQKFVAVFLCFVLFLKRFGAGPHRVEIELNYPDNPETNWYIMLEMAPLDEMPHSIHMFLELVSRGLMDNGIVSFYTNAHHAILGAPFANHLTPRDVDNVEWRINDSGYAEVMFQEYSEKFPHQKYTVGFSGRPGGPSFYINMKDNTKNHGPRGFAADGKGDPCFAKVITGFDVVEKMNQASGELKEGEWKDMMAGPIAVRSMKYIK